ncbi:hypothetical protein [Actinomadura litoris]|uniref:Uncharacterized protein n=1 Tax=Actinomadura litoris TaxID=2678616 RepID=A0A7K1KUV2_9ACTN|nr:hypothetical protein [Actinomadura litoris]MUN35964.1 hypothetical protein [Actinomadura litoris]
MNDDELLARVRAAFETLDPLPEGVLAAGRSALAWRAPSSVLAGLTGDLAGRVASGVRGGGVREITGRLIPSAAADVHVRQPGLAPGEVTARVEPGGLFCLPRVPEGVVSLDLRFPDGTSVVTSWVRL